MAKWLLDAWYNDKPWLKVLAPLEAISAHIIRKRRQKFLAQKHLLWRAPVPVVVIGNITVGGTGKTPLVSALARWLTAIGWQPGIISRGYKAKSQSLPILVDSNSDPSHCGDEPVMLAQSAKVPVVIDPNRCHAAQFLLQHTPCNIILADDGLQHYGLGRDIEIVVLDGIRMFGNQYLLPRGPLREPVSRLDTVDFIVINGELSTPFTKPFTTMQLFPRQLRQLVSGQRLAIPHARTLGSKVHVVAGIGNPDRVFATVADLGFAILPHAFADHHRFVASDFNFKENLPIMMTSKDAVKCHKFATDQFWVLDMGVKLPNIFKQHLLEHIYAAQ